MKKYAVSLMSLGYTRQSGAILYNPETQDFDETSVALVRNMIKENKVVGLTFNHAYAELQPDETYCADITVKTGVGKYRSYKNLNDRMDNLNYFVIKQITTPNGNILYELVNNKCGRIDIPLEGVIGLSKIVPVYGFEYNEDTDELKLHDSVIIEDRLTDMFENATVPTGEFMQGSKVHMDIGVQKEVDSKSDLNITIDIPYEDKAEPKADEEEPDESNTETSESEEELNKLADDIFANAEQAAKPAGDNSWFTGEKSESTDLDEQAEQVEPVEEKKEVEVEGKEVDTKAEGNSDEKAKPAAKKRASTGRKKTTTSKSSKSK